MKRNARRLLHARGMSLSLSVGLMGGRMGGPVGPVVQTLPQSASIIMQIDPASLALSDGASVTTITDTKSGFVGTSPASFQPIFKTNIANGKPALRFNITDARIDMGRPASVVTAMGAARTWSTMVVFKNAATAAGNFGAFFGSSYTNAFFGANAAEVRDQGAIGNFRASDPAGNVHTLTYSGDAGNATDGRMYLDGTMVKAARGQTMGTNNLFIGSVPNGGTFGGFGFTGDILQVIMWNTGIATSEALQAHLWACQQYGKPSPLVGLTQFLVFDGDSITYGSGVGNSTDSMPNQVAVNKTLVWGQFANVGKPGATVLNGGGGGTTMVDSAVRDVDGFKAVTGLPIKIVCGEWYNQGFPAGTTPQGVALADHNRAYATARKAADAGCTLISWTSTCSTGRDGVARDGFNASLVSTPGNFSTVVQVHTDGSIGTDAAAPPSASGNTYFTDDIHPNAAGNLVFAGLISPVV